MNEINTKILNKTIAQARKGKPKAMYLLYDQYSKAMFNVCMRMCSSREDAEDVLQEAFIAAFQKLDTYSNVSTFGAWLKRIVVNKCINHIKRTKEEWILTDNDTLVEDEMIDYSDIHFKIEKVNNAINALPDGYRIVATLYLLEGYDHQEIADILNVSLSNSKSQLMRAKKKIKQLLEHED